MMAHELVPDSLALMVNDIIFTKLLAVAIESSRRR